MNPHPHCTDAIALEAAAALENYEAELAVVARGGANASRLARADAAVRRTCSWCMRLPQLSVDAVALLLSHYRVLSELSRPRAPARRAAALLPLQAHQACIQRLRRHCRELALAPGSR
jgi:hypothetical protein